MSTRKYEEIEILMRTMSARTIMMHQLIAETMGVNTTDLKCVDIITLSGRDLTAGELAEASGLTTGAITGVIDRLEKAGLARRARDGHDRRRVIIKLTHAHDARLNAIFAVLQHELKKVIKSFTPRELEAIATFIDASNDIAYRQTLALRRKLARK